MLILYVWLHPKIRVHQKTLECLAWIPTNHWNMSQRKSISKWSTFCRQETWRTKGIGARRRAKRWRHVFRVSAIEQSKLGRNSNASGYTWREHIIVSSNSFASSDASGLEEVRSGGQVGCLGLAHLQQVWQPVSQQWGAMGVKQAILHLSVSKRFGGTKKTNAWPKLVMPSHLRMPQPAGGQFTTLRTK